MIFTWRSGVEPCHAIALVAGDHVVLYSECGDEEAVDHVLRGHDHLDVASHRDMQLVDLARAIRVFKLPHPLLADGIDLHRAGGWTAEFEIEPTTPHKDDHRNGQRNRAPGNLQRDVAVNGHCHRVLLAAVF